MLIAVARANVLVVDSVHKQYSTVQYSTAHVLASVKLGR